MKTFTVMIGAVPFDEIRAPVKGLAFREAKRRAVATYKVNPDDVWVKEVVTQCGR